jgi:acyl-CoA reductase-like NAD-dependent aldehyde dehydrogenase
MNKEIKTYGSIINGATVIQDEFDILELKNPYNQDTIAHMALSTKTELEQAIDGAEQAFHADMKRMPLHKRAGILRKAAALLTERTEDFAETLSMEAGKPIKDARAEVGRAVQVLDFAADEAKTLHGELLPMDAAIGGENRLGMVRLYPIGVIAAITPFNFPLNLALHKLAPAVASGNAVVLKPALKTPLSALKLAQVFYDAGLPENALQVVIARGAEIGDDLITDDRIAKITFTGSPEVGIKMRNKAGLKRITLELGSNSPNIIFEDADIDKAAHSLVKASFAFAGQVCISSQRIFVHESKIEPFIETFVPLVEQLNVGDPLDETTDVGPMISSDSCARIHAWTQDAVEEGAEVLTGGHIIDGQIFAPTVMKNVNNTMKIVCQETFAPIVSIIPFTSDADVMTKANDSDYGLQAGIFTSDINRAFKMSDELETGGVWVNEVSTYRQDNYPYGGVKLSGYGKEGVKYAIRDMTEEKFVGINLN